MIICRHKDKPNVFFFFFMEIISFTKLTKRAAAYHPPPTNFPWQLPIPITYTFGPQIHLPGNSNYDEHNAWYWSDNYTNYIATKYSSVTTKSWDDKGLCGETNRYVPIHVNSVYILYRYHASLVKAGINLAIKSLHNARLYLIFTCRKYFSSL